MPYTEIDIGAPLWIYGLTSKNGG